MARAYIALGSNLGDRVAHLAAARLGLEKLEKTRVTAFSSTYETEPVGSVPQGRYLNAVAELETDLTPRELMGQLAAIEQGAGRTQAMRSVKWGPRTLDLDLLLYDDRVIAAPDLVVPHPRMHERAFVLEPLTEINPDAIHPVLSQTAARLLDRLREMQKR